MGNWGFTPSESGYFSARAPILGIRGTGAEARVSFGNHLVYYVDPTNGNANDANLGTDPLAPLSTIQRAITLHNATINWAATPPYDQMATIVIAPGVYAENLTPPWYCRMVGLGMATGGDICVNIEPASGSCIAGTGLALYLYNIRFTCNTAHPVLDFGVFNSCVIEQCMIVDGNPGLATVGLDMTDAGGSKILRSSFVGNSNPHTIGIRSTGDFYDCEIIGCKIAAVTTGIHLSDGAGLCGNALIAHNYISYPVNGIICAAGGAWVIDNWIGASVDAISHTNANLTIANHVAVGGAGAIELAGTD